jgi:hypothetical protein
LIVRAALVVFVPLLCASAAVAQAPAPGLSTQAAATAAPAGTAHVPAKAGKRTREARKARRVAALDGRPARATGATGTVEEALTSCLSMWEPATHMSKVQWARACRRVAERLNDT